MVTYRHFRNTDPPKLVKVWNESLTGRGVVRLWHSSALEQQVFSKPFFDPEGLILAEEDGEVVGFAHAGFGPNPEQTAVAHDVGVICLVAVRPAYRRRGIGSELLRRAEEYLRQRGARTILAGQSAPDDPFYQWLYGGSFLPGFLASDLAAGPFLEHHGYVPVRQTVVLQRQNQKPPRVADPRFVQLRQRFTIFVDAARARPTWWQNCELGSVEPLEFSIEEASGGGTVATAIVMELEGFSRAWNQPAVGILDVQVRPDSRRQGIGKFFLTQILTFLHEQSFFLVETQVPEDNETCLRFFRSLGFEQVDTGKVYRKSS